MSAATLTITATFEDGVLRPDRELPLAPRQQVMLVVQLPAEGRPWPDNVAEIYRDLADEDRRLAGAMYSTAREEQDKPNPARDSEHPDMSEAESNQRVADKIRQDLEWQGQRFALGDIVALLDGEVIAIGKSLDDALRQLRSRDPTPSRGMLVEVRPPMVDVIR